MLRRGLAAYRSQWALLVTRTASHRSLATLDAVHNVDDFQRLARDKLERPLYEYLASGTGDEQTLRENRDAWGRIFLRPRVLRDVARVETRTELFGQPLSMPVFISPAGVHCLCDPEGERQLSPSGQCSREHRVGAAAKRDGVRRVAKHAGMTCYMTS